MENSFEPTKPVYQTATKVHFLYKDNETSGTVESFDSIRGVYKVRIAGGHIVSVPSDDCYTEEEIQEISKIRERSEIYGSEPEPGKMQKLFERATSVETLMVTTVIAIVASIAFWNYGHGNQPVPLTNTGTVTKPKTEAETLYERLNHLNSEDAKEWGACGRQEARKKEKEEILKRLNSLR